MQCRVSVKGMCYLVDVPFICCYKRAVAKPFLFMIASAMVEHVEKPDERHDGALLRGEPFLRGVLNPTDAMVAEPPSLQN